MRRAWRFSWLAAPLLLAGCAREPRDTDLGRSIRALEEAIAELDRDGRHVRADLQPVFADGALSLRDALHRFERASRGLEQHVTPDVPRGVEALAGSAEQLRRAAAAGRVDRLRALNRQIAVQVEETAGELRELRRGVRPSLRPTAEDPERLVGRVATERAVRAFRVGAGVYAIAALVGLASALAGASVPGRRTHPVVFAALLAIGLAVATGGARPIATLASSEIAIPSGDAACREDAAKGAALAEALRVAAELERSAAGARHAKGERAGPSGPLQGAELLELVRGGSRRMLLARARLAEGESAAPVVLKPASPAGVSDTLAREVEELAAECMALAATRGAADEARYYHALARSYLDEAAIGTGEASGEAGDRRARRLE